eukprot:9702857-Ditylum_brightwellii.AAC.1
MVVKEKYLDDVWACAAVCAVVVAMTMLVMDVTASDVKEIGAHCTASMSKKSSSSLYDVRSKGCSNMAI